MNPYLEYVRRIQDGVAAAEELHVDPSNREPVFSESRVLLFSPHPDDECITGLLPLRLMQELGMEITNVAVTYGSNEARREGRREELANACSYLGWKRADCDKPGLVALEHDDVVRILIEARPDIVFFPHEADWNSRHISTNRLLVGALESLPTDFSCTIVETEFWGAMDDPNLMVEGNAEQVAELVAATSLHVGEVARNPYHLLLPAWMQDNVRRGGELVGGQGGAVPDFSFATLYRLRKWENGGFVDALKEGTHVPCDGDSLRSFFS